jgi:hypothetical protein
MRTQPHGSQGFSKDQKSNVKHQSQQIKSNQMSCINHNKSNQIKSNQIKSNQMSHISHNKSNQIKCHASITTNQIKSNVTHQSQQIID